MPRSPGCIVRGERPFLVMYHILLSIIPSDMIYDTSVALLYKTREIIACVFRILGAILLALYIRIHLQSPASPIVEPTTATSYPTQSMHCGSRGRPQQGSIDCQRVGGTRTAIETTPPTSPYCRACTAAAATLRPLRTNADTTPTTEALPFLTCGGGCGSEHRAHLFSAEQRLRPDGERVCIGREGRLRLCDHVSFGWDEVRRRSRKARDGPAVARCTHGSHELSSLHVSPKAEFWRSKTGSIVVRLSMESRIPLGNEPLAQTRFEEALRATSATWWPRSGPWDPSSLFADSRQGEIESRGIYWFGHGDNTQFLMRMRPCTDEGGGDNQACAAFTIERTIVIHRGPWDAQWRSALDPLTYRQAEDADMEGVSWCSDLTCRSHEDEANGGRWGLRSRDLDRPLSRVASSGLKSRQRVRMRCSRP